MAWGGEHKIEDGTAKGTPSSPELTSGGLRRIRRQVGCASTFSVRPVLASSDELVSMKAMSGGNGEDGSMRKEAMTKSARSQRWWEHTGRGSVKILRGKPKLMTGCKFGVPPVFLRKW